MENLFNDLSEFIKNPIDFVQNKIIEISKEKLCESISEIPFIGPAVCDDSNDDNNQNDDNQNNDNQNNDNNENNILEGTPLEEINNILKEKLIGTPLENIGIEPIFLIIGLIFFIFIFCFIILIVIIISFYYFRKPTMSSKVEGIMKQYEFPIPPPPPPPPVNLIMNIKPGDIGSE